MGIYLSTPKTDKVSEDGENSRLRYGCSSMQGWRSTMEDAHAAFPDLDDSTSFFGVYDGHGGFLVSKFCAKFLHKEVLQHEAYASGDLTTSLREAFFRMDEMMRGEDGWRELEILKGKREKPVGVIEGETNDEADGFHSEEEDHSDYPGPHAGSTACVAIIRNRQLTVANAGDSRCVLSRKGQAYSLSEDHKPDGEKEKERILNGGGFVQMGRVNGCLNLSRAIGDTQLKRNKSLPAEKQILTADPDVTTVELCDDDAFLVVACDGIWDCFSNQELVDFVQDKLSNETKLSAVCERVFDKCLAPTAGGVGCDNMTMILVQFKKPPSDGSASAGPSI